MRMGQGVRTGLGHGGITCVLQTQFSSFFFFCGPVVRARSYGHIVFRSSPSGGETIWAFIALLHFIITLIVLIEMKYY